MSRMPQTGNEQKSVKPKVRKLLDRYGWFWWAQDAGPFGTNGKSDTAALKAGVFMAIESKFGNGRATALQIGYLNSVAMEDGFAFIVNEQTLPQLEIFLKHFGQATDFVRKSKGKTPDAEIGGPLLDALKVLTDYPHDMNEYARRKAARKKLAAEEPEPEPEPEKENTDAGPEPDTQSEDDHDD